MNRKNISRWTMSLAMALLITATGTACDQNTSGQQVVGQNEQKPAEQTEATQSDMEALAKVMPKYNAVSNFSEGLAVVCDKETHLYGFIDKKGNEVIPCQYYYIGPNFNEGIAVVYKSSEDWCLIDKQGNEIASFGSPYRPGFHDGFHDGLMAFLNFDAEKEGYIDKTGNVVIPAELEMDMCNGPISTNFSDGLRRWYDYRSQKTTFIDKTGNKVFECKGEAEDFSDGLAAVSRCTSDKDDFVCHIGFVDKTGSEVIPFNFKHAGYFVDGLCWAETENSCGFINREGKFELTGDYKTLVLEEDIECGECPLCPTFSEGLAWVCNKEGKFGYIDKTGKVVIPFRYEAAYEEGMEMYYQEPCHDFHDGLARIWDKTTDKYGYIDREGNEVFPCQFESAEDLSEGLAVVILDGKYGFIDAKGNCTLNLGK